jgi:hypothetical protein
MFYKIETWRVCNGPEISLKKSIFITICLRLEFKTWTIDLMEQHLLDTYGDKKPYFTAIDVEKIWNVLIVKNRIKWRSPDKQKVILVIPTIVCNFQNMLFH